MKIIIQNNSIAGTATDEYTGPDAFITAPDDFDASRMGEYTITDGVASLPPIDPREVAKAARTAAVAAITVTTAAGHTFDGDETSQTRMARAILVLQATGTPSINWVLTDNSVIQATAAELAEALALSGAAQAAIWVI